MRHFDLRAGLDSETKVALALVGNTSGRKKWQAGKLAHGPSRDRRPREPPTHRIYGEEVDGGPPWTDSHIQGVHRFSTYALSTIDLNGRTGSISLLDLPALRR